MKPVVLITGGAGVLGNAFCRAFASAFHIVAVYNTHPPKTSSQLSWQIDPGKAAPLNEKHPVFYIQGNLTNREDIRRIVEVTLARYDRIDHLIHSAADLKFHGLLKELWQAGPYPQDQLYLNSIAPMLLNSIVYDACWKDQRAENARWNRSITHLSSLAGLIVSAPKGQAFYSASKAAMNILSMHLAGELAPYSVRVNTVCPGKFVDDAYIGRLLKTIKRLMDDPGITGETITKLNP